MLPGTEAQRRAQLHVDGGDVEVDQIWKAAERGAEGGAARPRGAAGRQDGARSRQGFGHRRASASGGRRGIHHIARSGQGQPALPVDPDVQILPVGQLAKPGHVTLELDSIKKKDASGWVSVTPSGEFQGCL